MTESARHDLPVILEAIAVVAKPERVFLFGSQAEGTAGPDSDIDLCVVAETSGVQNDLQTAIRELLWNRVSNPLDLVFCDPARFKERSGWTASFEGGVAKRGIVVYGYSTQALTDAAHILESCAAHVGALRNHP